MDFLFAKSRGLQSYFRYTNTILNLVNENSVQIWKKKKMCIFYLLAF